MLWDCVYFSAVQCFSNYCSGLALGFSSLHAVGSCCSRWLCFFIRLVASILQILLAFCRSYRHFWVVGLLRHFLDLLQTLSILCAFKSHTNIDIMIKILENRKKRKRQRRKPCQRRYGPRRWLLLPIWLIFCIFSNFAHFTYFAYFICPAYSAYFAYFAHFTTNASIDRVS